MARGPDAGAPDVLNESAVASIMLAAADRSRTGTIIAARFMVGS
jgi:hypothetical protein